jgi:protein tyrosine phosphatase (PTP) superfamily phosphohydrolase (DUF442 family)
MKMLVTLCLALTIGLSSGIAQSADDLSDISNFRQYNPTFASSGQPSAEQLKRVADSGVERVIYLAYTDNETAIEDEDRTVANLGMQYIHIPVDFQNPTLSDFLHFTGVMQGSPETKTLLHCQINLRASAFSFLYRAIYLDVPVVKAMEDLQGVWAPNKNWFRFIETVAARHDLNIHCDDCDWGASEFDD